MRCWVKSRNERNPYLLLLTLSLDRENSRETAADKAEEGRDDVKSVRPLRLGLHTCYNGRYNRLRNREVELIPKAGPSSDWRLKLASMKLESLVTPYQPRWGEYVPGSCTHRPSSDPSWEYPK